MKRKIEIINPLEQGLKLGNFKGHRSLFDIEIINPLEQGLKPDLINKSSKAQNIEIINPLEQGLKHGDDENANKPSHLLKSLIH